MNQLTIKHNELTAEESAPYVKNAHNRSRATIERKTML